MKRLHYVNFFGVLVLVALCVVQWERDRQLNLEVNRSEKLGLDQAAKIRAQEQSLQDLSADLGQLKDSLSSAQTELNGTRGKLQTAEHEKQQVADEREQLKTSITNWAAAVATRDERHKEANAVIHRLSEELNTSISKFNELATNHNAVIKDLNDLRSRVTQLPPSNEQARQP